MLNGNKLHSKSSSWVAAVLASSHLLAMEWTHHWNIRNASISYVKLEFFNAAGNEGKNRFAHSFLSLRDEYYLLLDIKVRLLILHKNLMSGSKFGLIAYECWAKQQTSYRWYNKTFSSVTDDRKIIVKADCVFREGIGDSKRQKSM